MIGESLPCIWASIYSWSTPTVLFVFLNLVIGTIAYFSTAQKQEQTTKDRPHNLTRTSSILERVRSFKFYRKNTQELIPPPIITESEPIQTIQTVESSLSEPHDKTHLARIQSDTHPTSGELPAKKLPQKMKKSASAKSIFAHFHEEEIVVAVGGGVRRPSTTRERRVFGEDEEVDAKADDFINRFNQQLKLQRVDSILRYKEMLNRGK